jgi:hypothetical protein
VRNQIEQAIKRQEERLSMLIDGGETPSAEMATTISREDALVRRPLMIPMMIPLMIPLMRTDER